MCVAAPFHVDGKGTHIPIDMKNTPNQKKKKRWEGEPGEEAGPWPVTL